MPSPPRMRTDWLPWLYGLAILPAIALLLLTLVSAVYQRHLLAGQTRRLELERLKWRARQHAEGLAVLRDFPAREFVDRDEAGPTTWIEDRETHLYWEQIRPREPQFLYLAVVNRAGEILLHTDPQQAEKSLIHGWYDQRLPEFGNEFTWSQQSPLAHGRPAYDVSVGLGEGEDNGERLHVGLDAIWLDAQVAALQRAALWRWGSILALVGVVDLSAGWALFALLSHCQHVNLTTAEQAQRRIRELGQIGAGLAHEVRNPLHALRINLHTLRRTLLGKSSLAPEQITETLNESDASIHRLDELMSDLLQYASPSEGPTVAVDLVQEVQATLRLLGEGLKRDQIVVRQSLPTETAPIAIDPARLRQSLLNLLTFAQHRAGRSGTIEVGVRRSGPRVELAVGDSGPAIGSEQRRNMFEPFQATAETGSGLGLALVQSLVEEAGGQVRCDGELNGNHQGMIRNCCRVWFPCAQRGEGGKL